MNKKEFQERILTYYENEKRDLPWRKTTDPYLVLVSEIMLQQTQVTRVIEKFNEWKKTFPTIQDLANASLQDVLRLWSGLGYNSRGKRLWECAKIITQDYGGHVPESVEELEKLPGIGPYTARSILIFAHNKNIATVDTNIRRILIHEFSLSLDTTDKQLFKLAQDLVPEGKSRDWHNALMDYGSTILTAKKTGIEPKTKQSPFSQSKRYYRGQILKHLITHDELTLRQAKLLWDDCPYDLKEILKQLEQEELVKKEKATYYIAS